METETFLTVLITALIGLYLFIYSYVKLITFTYWKRHGIWQIPNHKFPTGLGWPVMSGKEHMGDFFEDIYKRIKSEGRKCAGFYFFTKPQIMITDTELIKHVLTTDFNHFRNRGIWCNDDIDPCSASLLSLPADRWKRIRAKFSPLFTPNHMKTMFPTMDACGPTLLEVTGELSDSKECFDMKELVGKFSLTVLGNCLFGCEWNALRNPKEPAGLVGKDIFEPDKWEATKRSFFFLVPQILEYFKFASNSKYVIGFFHDLVTQSVAYREENNINRADLMQIIVNSRQKDYKDSKNEQANGELTLPEMMSQCWVFFAGGYDSAATLANYCMYELSRHQDIQSKLREEVIASLEINDGRLTYESINEMKYMDKVIKETLRKYPTLTFLQRECTSEFYKFPNSEITLRKGDSIVISLTGLQKDPEYYPDPEKFDPNRFDDDSSIPPYTYMPFGEGPRNCVALKMGMLQGKYTIALLISKFIFDFNKKTKLPLTLAKNSFAQNVNGGIWLDAKRVS